MRKMIVPTKNNILVTLVETEKKQGMLIVPEEKKEFRIGKVYEIRSAESPIGVDDFVWFRKFSGFPIEYDGVTYTCLKIEDVMAFSSVLN